MKLIYAILLLMPISYILMYHTNVHMEWKWEIFDTSRSLITFLMAIIIHKQSRQVKYVVATWSLIIITGFELVIEILDQNKKGDVGDIIWQILVASAIVLTFKAIKWIK